MSEIEKLVHARKAKFYELVKTGDLKGAEEQLGMAEGLKKDKYELLRERSDLFLLKGDQVNAYRSMKLFFEGDPLEKNTTHGVAGANDMRPWYWYLTSKFGSQAKADKIRSDLFDQTPITIPGNGERSDPRKYSNVPLAQMYFWLANWEMGRTHWYSADRYLRLAKKADPSFKAPKEYDEWLNPYRKNPDVLNDRKDYLFPSLNTYAPTFDNIGPQVAKIGKDGKILSKF
ncbi:MAG: hypothetical protein JST12_08860 [Armatimonadetes bacterium]|nr:hypothetical protein [Armatimonadota bacterium]